MTPNITARLIACYLFLGAVLGFAGISSFYVWTLPTKHAVKQIVARQTNSTPPAIEKAAKVFLEQQAAQAGIAITSAEVVSFKSDGDTAIVVLRVKAVGLPGTTKIKVMLTKGVYQATGLAAA